MKTVKLWAVVEPMEKKPDYQVLTYFPRGGWMWEGFNAPVAADLPGQADLYAIKSQAMYRAKLLNSRPAHWGRVEVVPVMVSDRNKKAPEEEA